MKLHANWGHGAVQQFKSVPVDAVGENMHLGNHVDEVSEHCEVRRAVDKASHVPIAVGQ